MQDVSGPPDLLIKSFFPQKPSLSWFKRRKFRFVHKGNKPRHTSPVAKATKLSTVLGTTFPKRPITIRPTSLSPILTSKKTCVWLKGRAEGYMETPGIQGKWRWKSVNGPPSESPAHQCFTEGSWRSMIYVIGTLFPCFGCTLLAHIHPTNIYWAPPKGQALW